MILLIICFIVLPIIAAIIIYFRDKDSPIRSENTRCAGLVGFCAGCFISIILVFCAPYYAPVANIEIYPLHTEGQSVYYLNDKNEIEVLDTRKRISIEASDEVDKTSFQIVHYDFTVWPTVVKYQILIPGE